MYTQSLRRAFQTRPQARPLALSRPCQPIVSRQFHLTPLQSARKDAQDKDSLKPESNEYSKSGSDQEAAATDDAAFNPNKTTPEEEHDTAGSEAGVNGTNNPLNASPANHEISQPRGQTEGGPEGSKAETSGQSSRERTSGGGSPQKSGSGQYGGGGAQTS